MHIPGCQKNGAFHIGIQKNGAIHILFVEKRGPIIYLAALRKGAIRHAHPYYAIYRKLPPPPPPPEAAAPAGASSSLSSGRNPVLPTFQVRQDHSFRPYPSTSTQGPFTGACFACGDFTHFRRNCPFVGAEQHNSTAVKK